MKNASAKSARKYGNYHVLSEEEVKSFEDKYKIEYISNLHTIVYTSNKRHITLMRSINDKYILANGQGKKMSIRPQISKLWSNHTELSIFRLQNLYNYLVVMHQEPTDEKILEEYGKK